MLSLIASAVSRAASPVAVALDSTLPRLAGHTSQTFLPKQFPTVQQSAATSGKEFSYESLSLAPGRLHPSLRRVGGTFPKLAPAPSLSPFPAGLAIKRGTALCPVVSRPKVRITGCMARGKVTQALGRAAGASRATASTSPAPSSANSSTARAVKSPSPPSTTDEEPPLWIDTLTPYGQYKTIVLADWLDKHRVDLSVTDTFRAVRSYGMQLIEREEPYERELASAEARCPSVLRASWRRRCARQDVRIARLMDAYFSTLRFSPSPRLPAAPQTPRAPSSPLACECTAALLAPKPHYVRRATKQKHGLRGLALVNSSVAAHGALHYTFELPL